MLIHWNKDYKINNSIVCSYFEGYDDTLDPQITNSFATAAFRYGHSEVPKFVIRPDKYFNIDGCPKLFLASVSID